MDGSSTALPKEWIGRLFLRFRSIYGNKVQTMFGEADPADLTATWADVLARYEAPDLKRALETMLLAYPDYPPTLPQFAAMCRDARQARGQQADKVTYVRHGDPAPEILAAIHELTKDPLKRKSDPRDWARRILQREQAGEPIPLYAVQCAEEALGIGQAEL